MADKKPTTKKKRATKADTNAQLAADIQYIYDNAGNRQAVMNKAAELLEQLK